MSRHYPFIRRAILVLACLFAMIFWARSYSAADWFWYRTGAARGVQSVAIASCRGTITLAIGRASGRADSDAMQDRGFSHYCVDAEDLAIEPVPPDMQLNAGFGVMTTRPQDEQIDGTVWRFLVVPWWGLVTIAAAGSYAVVKLKRVRVRLTLPESSRMRPALIWN